MPGEEVKPAPAQAAVSPYDEALALYRQGRYGEAGSALSPLLDHAEATNCVGPLFGKAAALMAQALANQGDIASALGWLEQAIAIDKLNAELYYLRATIFQEQGDVSRAIASLKQALYLDHGFVLAYFALGTLTLQQGKPKAAVRHFENALSLLGTCQADEQVTGADGMTAGRLAEVIALTMASMSNERLASP
jgi:chemotaxis protein methyltransferase CheR